MSHNKIQSPDEPVASDDEAPPPYESREQIVADSQDDGRISISFNRRVAQRFSRAFEAVTKDARQPNIRSSWSIPMNLVIQVVGSRGDVQPFIALGCEFRKSQHRVRIATHPKFERLVKDAGLEFFSIGGDPEELMAYMVKNPSLLPSMKTLRGGDIQRKRAMIGEMLDGCWKSCIDPVDGRSFVADAIIANPPSFAHIHCAQALGIPLHMMFTMPWSSTKAYPHPLANLQHEGVDPGLANSASYAIVEFLTWQGLGDVINRFRKKLDLEPIPTWQGAGLTETLNIPTTYCWSPALIPKPNDWAPHINISGFFFRDTPDYKPPTAIADFLEKGSPPIYIGFGSIVLKDPDLMTKNILEAVRACGVRAIISRGWSKLDGDSGEDVLFIEDCPHEWLFKRVSAVIHHGGAGTTACSLANGCPTGIVPFFGDQPFWGDMVARVGAGPDPLPWRKFNVEKLTAAIQTCLAPETKRAAESIAVQMQCETGVKTAVKLFHSFLPVDTISCSILPDRPASWLYKKSIRLSRLAAEILIEKGYVHPIRITSRRWDPVTAGSSALAGTATNIVNHTVGILKGPYDEIRQHKTESGSQTALRAVGSSARNIGMFNVALFKGTMVDLPLAVTEGLKAVPKLYGETPQNHGVIDGWMSGGAVAGKSFIHGMAEGFSDLVMKPVEGSQDGAASIAKGVGKGLLGFTTKTTAATLGLVAYTGEGICKTIHKSVSSSTRKLIAKRKHEEGIWQLERLSDPRLVETVIRKFDLLKST